MYSSRPVAAIGGRDFKRMMQSATRWLERNALQINALNVFPVPDGDTGSNMLLSMRASVQEAENSSDELGEAARAMAVGALRGARGNSGIILSQFWQGLAQGLSGKRMACPSDLGRALHQARDQAYSAVSKPAEGTILTVMHDIARAAADLCSRTADLRIFLDRIIAAARVSVANTPNLLAVLRGAGVVDSGAQGLLVILEGAASYLDGGTGRRKALGSIPRSSGPPQRAPGASNLHTHYGYCTDFMLRGDELDYERLKAALENVGESLVIAGSRPLIRVHIHTHDPGAVFAAASALGRIEEKLVRNMDKEAQEQAGAGYRLLAGAAGQGFLRLFESLGAIPVDMRSRAGGSVWTRAIRRISLHGASDTLILLPNSMQVNPELQRVGEAAGPRTSVLPTKTIPQGIAAVLACNPQDDLETNLRRMQRASGQVRTVEIRRADEKGRYAGFLDGEPAGEGSLVREALETCLGRLEVREPELATLYYRTLRQAEKLGSVLRLLYPAIRVETYSGAHPDFELILSIE
jgi:DAK2 domain fusion protein YloV